MTTDPAATEPGPAPAVRTTTIVYVTAEGMPDAWGNGDEIELHVTPPNSAVEAVIVIPLAQARAWAADVYAAVTIAYREATEDPDCMGDFELATMPDPGRLIFTRLAEHWTDTADTAGTATDEGGPPGQAAAS